MSKTNFSEALKGLREGLLITRREWDGKRILFRQVDASLEVEGIVPHMTSLPPSAKRMFKSRHAAGIATDTKSYFDIKYHHQVAAVDEDNNITGYNLSWEDIFAEDWIVLNIETMDHLDDVIQALLDLKKEKDD
jgi:DNA-binding transcriptional ArsR family regulator